MTQPPVTQPPVTQPPRNPDFDAAVRASFARQGAMRTLAAAITRLVPGECEITMPFAPGVAQQHGYFHGGVVGMLGDSAGGYAGLSLWPAGADVVTVEYKVNFVAPAKGAFLRATGRVLRTGRTLSVVQVAVVALDQGREVPCAFMQQTLMAVPPP